MISSIILFVAFSLNVCSQTTVSSFPSMPLPVLNSPQGRDKLVDEQNIREAVFRYQFEHNASGQQQQAKIYFLSLGERRSPRDDFMSRFKGHKPPVRKVSGALVNSLGVVEKKTGRRGLLFQVTGIRWLGQNEVEVEGGYFESGHSASTNVYKVSRENGKWVVKEDRMREIS